MQDPLLDILDFFTANKLGAVSVDGFSDNLGVEQITIMGEPGTNQPQNPRHALYVAIYVKSNDKQASRNRAHIVRDLLDGKTGYLSNRASKTLFAQITIETEPYMWSVNESSQHIYLVRVRLVYNRNSTPTIYFVP
jgi:hypothetical protein